MSHHHRVMAAFTPGGVILFLTVVTTLFGNILVLYLLTKPQRRLLKRPLYIFIFNICIVDIAVVVFSMSFKTVDEIAQEWFFGGVMCHIVEYTQRALFRVNILMHLSIATDRYYSVVLALKPQMTTKQAKCIISVAWLFSFAITVPLLFSFDLRVENDTKICQFIRLPWQWLEKLHSVIDLLLFFLVPTAGLLWLYASISWSLMRRKRQTVDIGSASATRATIRASIRVVRVSIIVATSFLICWIPVAVKGFNRLFHSNVNTDRRDALYATAMYCAFINDAIVPLLYCGLDSNLQPAARELFCCFPKINPDDTSDYADARNE